MLSNWLPQHQPCSRSVLGLAAARPRQGHTSAGGCANLTPHFLHVRSVLLFPCHLCTEQDSGESVSRFLQCSLYPLLCQSPHRDYCREHNSPTAISILLPHWPLSCFCKVDPEPFKVFLGSQINQGAEQWIIPSQGNFSAINQGSLDKACDGLKASGLSLADEMLHA